KEPKVLIRRIILVIYLFNAPDFTGILMKILHYTHNLSSGGAEKLLTDILPLMKQYGHEVHLAYSNGEKNVKQFQQKLSENGIKIIDFNTSFYNPIQIFKLIKLL